MRCTHWKQKANNLFLNFQNGKFSKQSVVRGTIRLDDLKNYTGYAFRSASETFLVNKGVDILSDTIVAESYVEDSLK